MGQAVMHVFDQIETEFPESAKLEGFIIITDVGFVDDEGHQQSQIAFKSSSIKFSHILGLLEAARLSVIKNVVI